MNIKHLATIREICTYHADEGTSGYLLSDKQFRAIEEVMEKIHYEAYEEGRKASLKRLAKGIDNEEICGHMPDDPDVVECSVCGFKKSDES